MRILRWPVKPIMMHETSECEKCGTVNIFYRSFGEKLQLLENYNRRTKIWLTIKTEFYIYFKCIPCIQTYYVCWNLATGPIIFSYGYLSELDI